MAFGGAIFLCELTPIEKGEKYIVTPLLNSLSKAVQE